MNRTSDQPPAAWFDDLSTILGRPVDLSTADPLLGVGGVDTVDLLVVLDLEHFIQQWNPAYVHHADEQIRSLTVRDVAYYCGFSID